MAADTYSTQIPKSIAPIPPSPPVVSMTGSYSILVLGAILVIWGGIDVFYNYERKGYAPLITGFIILFIGATFIIRNKGYQTMLDNFNRTGI